MRDGLPECPQHPQAQRWHYEGISRCAICARNLSAPVEPFTETTIVRSLDYYQELTARTAGPFDARYFIEGLCEEVGEILGHVRKHLHFGRPLVRAKLVEEYGDALYHLARAASMHGIKLSEIATENDRKLRIRYPNGFNVVDAVERKDERK